MVVVITSSLLASLSVQMTSGDSLHQRAQQCTLWGMPLLSALALTRVYGCTSTRSTSAVDVMTDPPLRTHDSSSDM